MTEEQINEQKEEIEANANERAEKSLKTNFLLQEIARVEDIKVEDTEVLMRVQEIAQAENKPAKKVLKELQKNRQLDNIRNSVLLSKTIDFLGEHAKVSTKSEDEKETSE